MKESPLVVDKKVQKTDSRFYSTLLPFSFLKVNIFKFLGC